MQRRLVVKPHRPRRTRAIAVVGTVVAVLGAYFLYEFGREQGGFDRAEANDSREALEAQLELARAENTDLRRQIALLETSRGVDNEAYTQVEGTLAELQSQLQEQREELDFYRAIVTPADGASGLRIQEFKVTSSVQTSLYRLRLVLVQAAKHDQPVSGVVNLSVDGAYEGKSVTYELKELATGADASALGFSFRYFQNFERDVVLPDGFIPDRVNIEVTPKGRKPKVIRQSFDWSVQG